MGAVRLNCFGVKLLDAVNGGLHIGHRPGRDTTRKRNQNPRAGEVPTYGMCSHSQRGKEDHRCVVSSTHECRRLSKKSQSETGYCVGFLFPLLRMSSSTPLALSYHPAFQILGQLPFNRVTKAGLEHLVLFLLVPLWRGRIWSVALDPELPPCQCL